MILLIQTNLPGQLLVWVIDRRGKIFGRAQLQISYHGSEKVLRLVDQLLLQHKLAPSKLHRVVIVRGPGHFTALRTGLVVANTLAWVYGLPLQGVVKKTELTTTDFQRLAATKIRKNFTPARPWYGKVPNISKPKR